MTSDQKLVAAMSAGHIVNPPDTLRAFKVTGPNSASGFSLAACCAMLDQETMGGLNIWGNDPWNARAYPRGAAHPASGGFRDFVTQENYKAYKPRRNAGMQPQGCGPTQLTSAGYQEDAERAGGCWIPLHNMGVGFRLLAELFIAEHGALGAFGAYNGSGPFGVYAHQAVALMGGWQARFDHALA